MQRFVTAVLLLVGFSAPAGGALTEEQRRAQREHERVTQRWRAMGSKAIPELLRALCTSRTYDEDALYQLGNLGVPALHASLKFDWSGCTQRFRPGGEVAQRVYCGLTDDLGGLTKQQLELLTQWGRSALDPHDRHHAASIDAMHHLLGNSHPRWGRPDLHCREPVLAVLDPFFDQALGQPEITSTSGIHEVAITRLSKRGTPDAVARLMRAYQHADGASQQAIIEAFSDLGPAASPAAELVFDALGDDWRDTMLLSVLNRLEARPTPAQAARLVEQVQTDLKTLQPVPDCLTSFGLGGGPQSRIEERIAFALMVLRRAKTRPPALNATLFGIVRSTMEEWPRQQAATALLDQKDTLTAEEQRCAEDVLASALPPCPAKASPTDASSVEHRLEGTLSNVFGAPSTKDLAPARTSHPSSCDALPQR